jgi:hypothetical protein
MIYIYCNHAVFHELSVELLSIIRHAGYACDIISKVNQNNYLDLYLMFGMNQYEDSLSLLPQNYIVIQLEQTSAEACNWFTAKYTQLMANALEVWDYSLVNYQALKTLTPPPKQIRYVPIHYTPSQDILTLKPPSQRDLDVVFMGSLCPRREKLINDLRLAGLNVYATQSAWGQVREDLLCRTKIVVNLHYYESAILETTRLSYLLSNHILVVSESSADKLLDNWYSTYCKIVPTDQLVDTCQRWCQEFNALTANPDTKNEVSDYHFKRLVEYKTKPWGLQVLQQIQKLHDVYGHLMPLGDDTTSDGVPTAIAPAPPTLDSSDIPSATFIKNAQGELVLKLPPLTESQLPKVSIITVTYQRKHLFPMAIRNWNEFVYPSHLMEWIIVDEEAEESSSDDDVKSNSHSLSDILPKDKRIKYHQLKTTGRLSIGQKRNYGVKQAQHDYVIFMDDDDYYYPISVYARIALLLSHPTAQLVGVTDLDMYDTRSGYSARIRSPFISEASMAFKKSFWVDRPFPDQFSTLGEGVQFLKERRHLALKMPSAFNLIAMTHKGNYSGNSRTDPNQNHKQPSAQSNNILYTLDSDTRQFITKLFK